MSDAPKKAKSLGATVIALVFAGLYFLAQQMGLINPDGGEDSGGSGTTVAQAPTGSATEGGVGASGGGGSQIQGSQVETEGGIGGTGGGGSSVTAPEQTSNRPRTAPAFDTAEGLRKVEDAFANNLSDVILGVEGEIVHLLPDDNEGSRHQLFLLEISDDITLKISHNIDQAPYIPVERGDTVRVFGEYEWNSKGGVVHWTHLAHGGNHPDGYIEHKGRFYQ